MNTTSSMCMNATSSICINATYNICMNTVSNNAQVTSQCEVIFRRADANYFTLLLSMYGLSMVGYVLSKTERLLEARYWLESAVEGSREWEPRDKVVQGYNVAGMAAET